MTEDEIRKALERNIARIKDAIENPISFTNSDGITDDEVTKKHLDFQRESLAKAEMILKKLCAD